LSVDRSHKPENLTGRDYAEYLDAIGRIILEWISGKQGMKVETGCI
jgi:hypothetical protein